MLRVIARSLAVISAVVVTLFCVRAAAQTRAETIGAWNVERGELVWAYPLERVSSVWLELHENVLIVHASYNDAAGPTDFDVYLDTKTGRVVPPPDTLGAPLAETAVGDSASFSGTTYGVMTSPQGPPKPPSPDPDPTDSKGKDSDCECRAVGRPESGSAVAWLALFPLFWMLRRRRA
jgi:hypothetical protein